MLLPDIVLKKLLTHPLFHKISRELAEGQGLAIVDEGSDDEPQIIRIYQTEFLTSGCSEEDLIDILEHDQEGLKRFFVKTLKLSKDDVRGEFPPGEEMDEDGLEEEDMALGYDRYFLLPWLLRYDFLRKNNAEGLVSFFQKMRIPGAKKYAKDLKKLHDTTL